MNRISTVLLTIQTFAQVGLILRLVASKLRRTYPFFFSYIALALVQSAVLAMFPRDSLPYRYVWATTLILMDCMQALVVSELYTVVLRDLGGFARLARRYVKIAFALAVIVSLLLLALEKTPKGPVGTAVIVDRVVAVALVILVLLITGFLVYYPIPLSKNTVVYSIGFAAYFSTKSAGRILETISTSWYNEVNLVFLIVPTACLIYWMAALNQKGEEKSIVIGHRWNPEEEERLLAQLKEINASLLRAARK